MAQDYQDSPAHTAMVSAEFQRAFEYSLRLREEHGGDVRAAFVEFVMEPDMVWHWNQLGMYANADLVTNAVSMVSQMQHALGGSGVNGLPNGLTEDWKYEEAIYDARCLVGLYARSRAGFREQVLNTCEERSTEHVISIFTALIMSAFAPAPTGGGE